ncbi:MAG TPA: hypothetical protein VI258_15075, partial [Rhodanobacteraceae bacterium]
MPPQHEPIELVRVDQKHANAGERVAPRIRRVNVFRETRGEPERGAFSNRAGHADPPAHHVDELFRDRQAEPRAAEFARRRTVGLHERIEEALLIAFLDADAGVVDEKPQLGLIAIILLAHHRQIHFARFGELHRVADEIQQHLPQAHRIAREMAMHIGIDDRAELQSFRRRALGKDVGDAVDELVEIEIVVLNRQFAGFDLRQIENVIHEPQHRLGAASNGHRDVALLCVEPAAEKNVRHPDHAVHRRADLVAHVGEKFGFDSRRLERGIARLRDLELHLLALGNVAG